FGGRLPEGVRITSKCNLGDPPAHQIEGILRRSIEDSLGRLRLSRLDLLFLHSNVVPYAAHIARRPEAAARMTLYPTFVDHVRPAFEKLRRKGHRRLGTDGHRPSRYDHQASRRKPDPGCGTVHRKSA